MVRATPEPDPVHAGVGKEPLNGNQRQDNQRQDNQRQ